MQVGKGVVGKISQRQFGDKTFYSFALKGQDGWYGLGEHSPSFREGDSIQFEVAPRGKYLDARNVAPWDGQGDTPSPAVRQVASRGGFQRKPFAGGKSDEEKAYWANRDAKEITTQRRIEIQAARNAAIETVKLMVEKELVKLPAKQADKYDALLALISEVADTYLRDTQDRLDGGPSAAPEAPEDPRAATPPEADEEDSKWD